MKNRRSAVQSGIVAIVLALAAHPATAQSAASRDPSLTFFGFRPGMGVGDIDARLQRLGGSRLRCTQAKADTHVAECRGIVSDPDLGGPVNLWMSAIDSVSGVLTLSSAVTGEQLDHWRGALESVYGQVGAQAKGTEWMMQWVRHGRMIRLTWRTEHGERIASVSLVDGGVLDTWGRARAHARSH